MNGAEIQQDRTVNHGARVDDGGNATWVKTFAAHALGTGIKLPYERQLIEARTCEFLPRLIAIDSSTILLPQVLCCDFKQHRTSFRYVAGLPLRNLCLKNWPSLEPFHQLGRLLAKVEKVNIDSLADLFRGIEKAEEESKKIIRHYKFISRSINKTSTFALGDVSLSNLSVISGGLYLYDFEFAHREASGFDIGQLLAEIDVRRAVTGEELTGYSDSLVHGYLEDGGDMQLAEYWRQSFKRYYFSRYKFPNMR